ncbi:unnamed protein product [Ixodes pacificus]
MAAAAVVERSRVMLNLDKQKEPPLLKNPAALEESIDNEDDIQTKVQNILEVGQQLSKEGKAKELGSLIKSTRPFLNLISKAKAAKLVRALVDMFLDMEAATGMEVELCKECIDWAQQEKRTFLRQSLEARLIALNYDTGRYTEALALGESPLGFLLVLPFQVCVPGCDATAVIFVP